MTPAVMSARRAGARVPAATALPLLFVSLVALQGCDVVTADLKHSETAEWRKTYELSPGGRVEINNVNGRIDVEPSAGNTVEVVAQKLAKATTPAAAKEALERIEIREEVSPSTVQKESVSISTRLPRGGGWFDMGGAQVKYSVRVPAGAEVKFTTVNGGVSVTGLSGRVTAETTNGGVVAREISGTIDASTTNGGVDVELARLGEGGAKLGCTNGGIKLLDLGQRHQRRHRHERAVDRDDAVVATAARGPPQRRRCPDPDRRHERRHPDRPAIELVDQCCRDVATCCPR